MRTNLPRYVFSDLFILIYRKESDDLYVSIANECLASRKYGKMFISFHEKKSRKIHLSGVEVFLSFRVLVFFFLVFGNLTEHKHEKNGEGGRKCSNSVININLFLCKLKND